MLATDQSSGWTSTEYFCPNIECLLPKLTHASTVSIHLCCSMDSEGKFVVPSNSTKMAPTIEDFYYDPGIRERLAPISSGVTDVPSLEAEKEVTESLSKLELKGT